MKQLLFVPQYSIGL